MKGVILAGGTGLRLSPLTKVTNKHLLPVYDEPMIYKVIKTLSNSGITDITIVLGGESVGDFIRLLGDGNEFGANFTYIFQKSSGGIAEALYLTKKLIKGNKVAVILGDNIFEDTFQKEVKEFENSDEWDCVLFLKEVSNPEKFGIANLDNNNNIINIEEKPKGPKSNLCVTGLYLYNKDLFDIIERVINEIGYSERGELEITDVNNKYIIRGKTKVINISGFWSDVGTLESLLEASNYIKSKQK